MRRLAIRDLHPGMVLATEVVDVLGRLLLKPGETLTAEIIERLPRWNVPFADVVGIGDASDADEAAHATGLRWGAALRRAQAPVDWPTLAETPAGSPGGRRGAGGSLDPALRAAAEIDDALERRFRLVGGDLAMDLIRAATRAVLIARGRGGMRKSSGQIPAVKRRRDRPAEEGSRT